MNSAKLFVMIILAGVLTGCSKKEPTPQPEQDTATTGSEAPARQPAAALEGLTYVKGEPVTFQKGNVYVVEFWATWCPPCRTSIPHLTEIQKNFKDKGVTVIGVSNEAKNIEKVKSFVAEQGEKMDYTVAVDVEGKVGDGYMEAYKQRGIPTAFVVDGQGNVAWVGHPMSGLDEMLEQIVEEASDTIDLAEDETETEAQPKTEEDTTAATEVKAGSLDGLIYVKGEPVTFQEDKVYVVEFWATWCGPCLTSIPHLTEVQKKYKDKGVTVIGISSENTGTVKPFVEKMGEKMEYTVAVDTSGSVNNAYMKAFNQRGIPAAFIVDGKSNVAWVGHPMSGLDEVLELVVTGTFDPEAYAKAEAERQAAERELHKLYQDYNGALIKGASIEETRPIAEKIIESKNPGAMNALAWQILSMPSVDEAKRDTEIALKAAATANTQTNGENPMILDTYALALFQNDRVDEAVAAQQKAIDLVTGNERMQADMKTRLEQFKAVLEPAI